MSLPKINRQAENEQGADTAEASDKRKRISKRDFIGPDGSVVDKIEEASGGRYTLLAPEGNLDFDAQLGSAGQFATMCAIFGFHTKVGNVANTVLNDKDEPGTPADAGSAIRDFIAQAQGGTWAERATGAPGTRVDKPALAGSVVAVMLAEGKITAATEGDIYAKVLAKLEAEPEYVRRCRSVPAVASEYNTRVGKAAKTVDSLMI